MERSRDRVAAALLTGGLHSRFSRVAHVITLGVSIHTRSEPCVRASREVGVVFRVTLVKLYLNIACALLRDRCSRSATPTILTAGSQATRTLLARRPTMSMTAAIARRSSPTGLGV